MTSFAKPLSIKEFRRLRRAELKLVLRQSIKMRRRSRIYSSKQMRISDREWNPIPSSEIDLTDYGHNWHGYASPASQKQAENEQETKLELTNEQRATLEKYVACVELRATRKSRINWLTTKRQNLTRHLVRYWQAKAPRRTQSSPVFPHLPSVFVPEVLPSPIPPCKPVDDCSELGETICDYLATIEDEQRRLLVAGYCWSVRAEFPDASSEAVIGQAYWLAMDDSRGHYADDDGSRDRTGFRKRTTIDDDGEERIEQYRIQFENVDELQSHVLASNLVKWARAVEVADTSRNWQAIRLGVIEYHLGEVICESIRQGRPMADAAKLAGISTKTLYKRIEKAHDAIHRVKAVALD